jgi:hypothetical protein
MNVSDARQRCTARARVALASDETPGASPGCRCTCGVGVESSSRRIRCSDVDRASGPELCSARTRRRRAVWGNRGPARPRCSRRTRPPGWRSRSDVRQHGGDAGCAGCPNGIVAVIVVPRSWPESISRRTSSADTRSVSPRSPEPAAGSAPPMPSSETSTVSLPFACPSCTPACVAAACLATWSAPRRRRSMPPPRRSPGSGRGAPPSPRLESGREWPGLPRRPGVPGRRGPDGPASRRHGCRRARRRSARGRARMPGDGRGPVGSHPTRRTANAWSARALPTRRASDSSQCSPRSTPMPRPSGARRRSAAPSCGGRSSPAHSEGPARNLSAARRPRRSEQDACPAIVTLKLTVIVTPGGCSVSSCPSRCAGLHGGSPPKSYPPFGRTVGSFAGHSKLRG